MTRDCVLGRVWDAFSYPRVKALVLSQKPVGHVFNFCLPASIRQFTIPLEHIK